MKKIIIFLSTFIFSFLFLIVPIKTYSESKDYTIENLIINAEITPEGNVQVNEEITYNFTGNFSKVFRNLSHKGTTGYKINNVSVKDKNGVTFLSPSSDSVNNSFDVKENNNSTEINIFSKSSNESKTYIINYTILDCVKKYEDFGELYWNFYTVENNKDVQNFQLNIYLQDSRFILNKTKYWTYLDSSKESTNYNENFIEISGNNLTSLLGIKLKFQPEFLNIPTSIYSDDSTNLESNLGYDDTSSKNNVLIVSIFVLPIAIISIFIIIKRKRFNKDLEEYRDNYVFFTDPMLSIPPNKLAPALVNLLYKNMQISHSAIPATLLYLSVKGYYTMKKDTYVENKLFGKNKTFEDLRFYRDSSRAMPNSDHLREFIEWFSLYEVNGTFSLKSIEHFLQSDNKGHDFQQHFTNWCKTIKKEAENLSYYTQIKNKKVLSNEMNNERLKWLAYKNYIIDCIKSNNINLTEQNITSTLIYGLSLEVKALETTEFLEKLKKLTNNNLDTNFYLLCNTYNLFFINLAIWNQIYYTSMYNDSGNNSFGGSSSGSGFSGGGGGGSGAC